MNRENEENILNWHLTRGDNFTTVGPTKDKSGHYPKNEEHRVFESIVAPGEFIAQHPLIRREGYIDYIIEKAILDWEAGRNIEEIETELAKKYQREDKVWADLERPLSEKEIFINNLLDQLGDISRSAIEIIFKEMEKHRANLSCVKMDWKKFILSLTKKTNSKIQRELIQKIVNEIESQDKQIEQDLQSISSQEISKIINSKIILTDEDIEIIRLPGAIGILINNTTFQKAFPNYQNTEGFYKPDINYGNNLATKIFVINKDKRAKIALRHEYVHVLNFLYFEPFKISSFTNRELAEVEKEINNTQSDIENLDDELNYADENELKKIYQDIRNLKRKLKSLREKYDSTINNSEEYVSNEAKDIFKQMRDELSAYAIGGEFQLQERLLLQGNQNITLKKAIEKIPSSMDKTKIIEGWRALSNEILNAKRNNIDAKNIFSIFLTSSNFVSMTKRVRAYNNLEKKEAA